MLNKLTEDEIGSRKNAEYYDDVEVFSILEELKESGLVLFDENNNVINMYKADSKEDTIDTMKKVISVCDLGEEEITKFNKIRTLIKRFFDVCFKRKFSVFLLAMAFLGMFVMGIKEKVYVVCLIYTWGFLAITDTSKALKILRDSIEEYKVREDALKDESFMKFFNEEISEEVDNVMIYSLKK